MQVIKLTLLTCGEPWNLISRSNTMLKTNSTKPKSYSAARVLTLIKTLLFKLYHTPL